MDEDTMGLFAAFLAVLAVPVTWIVKAVSLSKDVEANRHEAAAAIQLVRTEALAAVSAHERLCEERMRSLMLSNAQILEAITRISERIDSM